MIKKLIIFLFIYFFVFLNKGIIYAYQNQCLNWYGQDSNELQSNSYLIFNWLELGLD